MKAPKFWYQKGGMLKWILCPLSWLFFIVVCVRRLLYKLRILRSKQFKLPVLVVGNITVGGTGKTPLVCALAHFLASEGLKPVVVSRGYGGLLKGPCVVDKRALAKDVGDEALLLALKTRCPVVIARKRTQALNKITQEMLGDIVILDDGLQHYALKRDLEIVVIDGEKRFGNGCLLPAGPLREPQSRLKSVDFIVANGPAQEGEYSMQYLAHQFKQLKSGAVATAEHFNHKSICAIAGIGFPDRFFTTLSAMGLEFDSKPFPDHHEFTAEDLKSISNEIVLMTEKDAVKVRDFADDRCWVLPIEADLSPGFFDAVFERIVKIHKEK